MRNLVNDTKKNFNETVNKAFNPNIDSDSNLDDIFAYDSESEESDTASVDHLFDGEEEVYDVKTRKPDPTHKKIFDVNFLSRIYNGLPRDEYAEKDVSVEKDVSAKTNVTDKDNIGDHWPIHYPTIKRKLMRHVLGEKYEYPEQLKRALVFYGLANGYKLYYEVNNPRRLLAKCCRDEKDRKCPFSSYSAFDHDHDILVESRSWILQLVSEPRGSRSRITRSDKCDVVGFVIPGFGFLLVIMVTAGTGLGSYWIYNVSPGHEFSDGFVTASVSLKCMEEGEQA
ncbi:hypothetical protein Tco_0824557 [Tanacetum coccineum]|uniref:Transposase MuDR plant domain-containing protein n=1 Tax=Tanacetum coccineum TaxID=301880 RepID=A0ABQ5AQ35_9ASTR